MKPRIFISHSTKTTEAETFLLAVEAALKDDYDVRLDKDGLKLGDDWRRTLYGWMDQAHGAVLLLTEAALNSSFVPIEASVLSWRHYRDPNFAFLPVFVDATGFAALKRRPVFRALALDVFQITRVDSDDVPAAIDAIREALRRFQAQFPHPKKRHWNGFNSCYAESWSSRGSIHLPSNRSAGKSSFGPNQRRASLRPFCQVLPSHW